MKLVCVCTKAVVVWPCLPLSHTQAHTLEMRGWPQTSPESAASNKLSAHHPPAPIFFSDLDNRPDPDRHITMILIRLILSFVRWYDEWMVHFNSRFSDMRADLRITSAAHYGSDAATGADHGRYSQVNACFYTQRYVYIIPATPRHVSEASQNLVVSWIQLLLSWCDLPPHGGWNKTSSEP